MYCVQKRTCCDDSNQSFIPKKHRNPLKSQGHIIIELSWKPDAPIQWLREFVLSKCKWKQNLLTIKQMKQYIKFHYYILYIKFIPFT